MGLRIITMAALQLWVDGSYKVIWNEQVIGVSFVEGEDAIINLHGREDDIETGLNKRIWKSGTYDKTDPKIFDATGKRNYEVRMYCPAKPEDEVFGVVSDDGKIITAKGGQFGVIFTMIWLDEEETKALKDAAEETKDPYDAPPNHYTLKPGHVGQLVWITGAPGFGKSTTARRMMEKHGFVYYEGDCFFELKNPYLPPSENTATDALLSAKRLKGVPNEVKAAVAKVGEEWKKAAKGEDYDMTECYSLMCENILKERKRIGGDWVVAQAVLSRKHRDIIRERLGHQLKFVVLDLDKDLQLERLRTRGEAFEELLGAWMKLKYDPVSVDEENAIYLKITRDMKLNDVVTMIIDNLNNY